jgi:heme-degrading monooxygenase HmoA
MFMRAVELISKSGKSKELSKTINDTVLPILRKQQGFVDEMVLVSNTEPDRILALSFWKTQEDAERYQREQFQNVHDKVRHLLETVPNVRTFEVHTSTGHKIAEGRAA